MDFSFAFYTALSFNKTKSRLYQKLHIFIFSKYDKKIFISKNF